MDPTNWNKERDRLKTEIFRELREQKDRANLSQFQGTITLDPQSFIDGKYQTVGPFLFETQFRIRPKMAFGQHSELPGFPWMVSVTVHDWLTTQGTIEGFYLGVLPLIAVPTSIRKHYVDWQAIGKASAYKSDKQQESWLLSYNEEKAHHLEITE